MAKKYKSNSMQRISQLDLIDVFPKLPRIFVQFCIVMLCVALAIGARMLIDLWVPGAGPYAVNLPFVLLATLVGRLSAGLTALAITSAFTWYYVMPFEQSFSFENAGDGPRTAVNIATNVLTVLLADAARSTGRWLLHEKEERICERDMLLKEVDHRVKNNLAILGSLLSLQQRESGNEEVQYALQKASGRVHSMATAYESLRYEADNIAIVDISDFLNKLGASIRNALAIEDHIKLVIKSDTALISRDRAGAVGLLINELVTNAVKHAFTGKTRGEIRVEFRKTDGGALLTVIDDGHGIPQDIRDGAQGQKFLHAFAQMAKGTLVCDSNSKGTRYTATLEELP